MNLWPRSLRLRLELREREADDAEKRLAEARAVDAHVRRVTAEARRIKHVNGFTEAIRVAMGVQQ